MQDDIVVKVGVELREIILKIRRKKSAHETCCLVFNYSMTITNTARIAQFIDTGYTYVDHPLMTSYFYNKQTQLCTATAASITHMMNLASKDTTNTNVLVCETYSEQWKEKNSLLLVLPMK